jgi:hypothetical protein
MITCTEGEIPEFIDDETCITPYNKKICSTANHVFDHML